MKIKLGTRVKLKPFPENDVDYLDRPVYVRKEQNRG